MNCGKQLNESVKTCDYCNSSQHEFFTSNIDEVSTKDQYFQSILNLSKNKKYLKLLGYGLPLIVIFYIFIGKGLFHDKQEKACINATLSGAKDPDSVIFDSFEKIKITDGSMAIFANIRGKNSFGAMIRNRVSCMFDASGNLLGTSFN